MKKKWNHRDEGKGDRVRRKRQTPQSKKVEEIWKALDKDECSVRYTLDFSDCCFLHSVPIFSSFCYFSAMTWLLLGISYNNKIYHRVAFGAFDWTGNRFLQTHLSIVSGSFIKRSR